MKKIDCKSFLIGFLFAVLIFLTLWFCIYKDIGRYQISSGYMYQAFIVDTKTGAIKHINTKYKSFQDIPWE